MILAAKETQMPDKPAPPTARTALAQEVRARVAASNQVVAQVRYVDRLLHSSSQRPTAAEQAEETRSAHLVEVMEHEVAVHERAVALHEAAAELQEEGGWPEWAAAAQEHVEELRKRLP
jgi:hypothetical protein